ncbi:uncharacterized protein LOC141671334 isoform X3 [Apium graveolens]|uniref:uncharacterized protein LOC141671334 isoform X3 n=1 Tax=Apium graveolens TaxID=4045 RepID=UPI003D7A00E8
MTIVLSSKLKLGFIDGSYEQPSSTSPLLMHWIVMVVAAYLPILSSLKLPNGQCALVTLIRDVHLSSDLILYQVLCDLTWKKNKGIGRVSKGLYLLNPEFLPSGSSSQVKSNTPQVCSLLSSSSRTNSRNKIADMWHARMGHVPSSVL